MVKGDRVIFWDFDGTLGYRPENWSGALIAVLADHDYDHGITVEAVRPYLREGFYWHTPDVPHPELTDPVLYWRALETVFERAYVAAGVSEVVAQSASQKVRDRCLDPSTYTLFEDTVPVLATLSAAGWRHRMITNHVPEFPSILEALGLRSAFDHVTNSGTAGYEKPHPEIFRLALEAAGQPRQAWMVGDNVVADVLGAESAGMRGILVRQKDSRARWSCPGLADVAKVIVESSNRS